MLPAITHNQCRKTGNFWCKKNKIFSVKKNFGVKNKNFSAKNNCKKKQKFWSTKIAVKKCKNYGVKKFV